MNSRLFAFPYARRWSCARFLLAAALASPLRATADEPTALKVLESPNKALADLAGGILASLRNHKGKGIERTNEEAPARWRLKEAAN